MSTSFLATLATVIIMSNGSNFFFVSEGVVAWLPVIHEVRDDMGLSAAKYSDALLLSLIHRESFPLGDASSHTEGTSYYGLLQMSDAYVQDACEYLGKEPVPARQVNGKPALQFALFFAYNERYKRYHGYYRPSYVALMHKAGVGSMAKDDLHASGHSARGLATEHLQDDIPEVEDYVNSWSKLLEVYATWIDNQNTKVGVCSAQYQGPYHTSWHGAGRTRYDS